MCFSIFRLYNPKGFEDKKILRRPKMAYEKPEVLATNNPQGSFAAGCPEKGRGGPTCANCERTK